ncbi:sugar ABC transporter substrate-binding protein [Microbacterium sp. B2969]|uniref:Sugar ABC transporter substrate-binding protein n=1 Tax=Microbacterium alkaliflavum TaxID=3248839 RepID=A0ABW7QG97_9MICO
MNGYHLRLAGVVGAASLALSLAACTSVQTGSQPSGSAGATDITIAGVFGNTFDPFWTSLGCGAAAQAKEAGVTYKEFASSSADTTAFDQSFNSATLINPTGILVNPLNPDQFVSQYQTLMQKGVPVVTINGSTPPAQYKIVGTDVENLDFLPDLVDLIPKDDGKLAVIDGVPGLVPVTSRLDPVVKAILDGRPGLTALETQYTTFDTAKATQAVNSLIVGNPDLRVIVASNGPDGAATAAAVKAAGKAGEIAVIALDATPPEVAALKDGTITALVAQAPKKIGAEQVKTLVDYLSSQNTAAAIEPSEDKVGVPQKLLTKDNVDDPDNSDWVYTAECK